MVENNFRGIPLKYCHVDNGRVSFLSFDEVTLPSLSWWVAAEHVNCKVHSMIATTRSSFISWSQQLFFLSEAWLIDLKPDSTWNVPSFAERVLLNLDPLIYIPYTGYVSCMHAQDLFCWGHYNCQNSLQRSVTQVIAFILCWLAVAQLQRHNLL